MAIPAMALLQQHDARQDMLIEPTAWWRAAIEAPGHSELGAQLGHKNQLDVLISVTFLQYLFLFQHLHIHSF